MQRTFRHLHCLGFLICFALALASCFDGDDRCGVNQSYSSEESRCQCTAGYVVGEGTCVVEAVPPVAVLGLGEACQRSEDCGEAYPHCQDDDDGVNYCSVENCTDDSECGEVFACATWESPSFCVRPPTGIGQMCSTMDDCSEFEASLCEVLVVKQCLADGCSVENNDCPVGFFCCDVTAFGGSTACLPEEYAELCPG